MKIRKILEKINKKDSIDSWCNIHDIASREFDIHDVYSDSTCKLKRYNFGNWYCTDTIVGNFAYFLDGEPVAISYQQFRKSYEEFKWLSKEAYLKTKNYLLTLKDEEEDNLSNKNFISLDDDIETTYKLNYNTNLLDYHMNSATLNGKVVNIIEKHKGEGFDENKNYLPNMVKIKDENKKEYWINIKELDFHFELK